MTGKSALDTGSAVCCHSHVLKKCSQDVEDIPERSRRAFAKARGTLFPPVKLCALNFPRERKSKGSPVGSQGLFWRLF